MKSAQLLAAVFLPSDFPKSFGPVVAFAGRSNVGKSSLLNRLLGEGVARVSKSPGRTQAIFLFDSKEGWIAADLPGFGFARVSRERRQGWAGLAEGLFERHSPHLTLQLIDPKIPLSDFDLEFRDYLRGLGLPVLGIATKADRLKQSERSAASKKLAKEFGSLLFVSSRTGEGIETLRKQIQTSLAAEAGRN